MALSYAGFMLNLFNLIPITPLDGGRIVSIISPKIWFVGIPLLAALFLWNPNPLLVLIAILATPQLWSVLKNKELFKSEFYKTSRTIRVQYAFQYLILVCLLSIMSFEVHMTLGGK